MFADVLGVLFWGLLLWMLWYCWFDLRKDKEVRPRFVWTTLVICVLITFAVFWIVVDFLEIPIP